MNWTIILVAAWIGGFVRMRRDGHTLFNAITVSALIAVVMTGVIAWAVGQIVG